MNICIVPCLSDNYAYLLLDPNRRAVVVDPSDFQSVTRRLKAEQALLTAVWLTHHHLDHTAAVQSLIQSHGPLQIIGSALDMERGRIAGQTHGLRSGDELRFGDDTVEVISVPGHTLGCIAYLVEGCLFCGDTLFVAGCGRVFEGTMDMMRDSLGKLRDLHGSTRIYCGHEYTMKNLEFARTVEPESIAIRDRISWARDKHKRAEPTVGTTMSDELTYNPFLRWDSPRVMEAARQLGAESDDATEVFAAIRRAKDRF